MENPNRLFSELDGRIRAQGLLNWSPYFYIFSMAATAALIAASFFILANVHNFWLQLANALLLAFSFGQLGFFLHDVGHGQVVGSRWHRWMGIVFSLILGWSLTWWIHKHNRHHAFPNQEGKDPDIDFAPLAFSKDQADQKSGAMRSIVRHQAALFIPMLAFEAWNLRVASIRYLLHARMKERYLLLALIVLHVVLYGWLLLSFLPVSWAISFAGVHWSALGIYLGLSFAPNHKGMPIVKPGVLKGFLEQQLYTTRNMRGGIIVDMLTGGLNYQIEHHLWPSMQRRSLKRAAVIVEEFCRIHGLPYHAVSVKESYGEIFGNFSKVSAAMK